MTGRIHRRQCMVAVGAGVVSASLMEGILAQPAPKVTMTTHIYKRVGSLEIKLDLHRPEGNTPPPVVVWIHGGALIMGHRGGIDRRVKQMLLGKGLAIASIDYRLAPETKLPEILSDVEDAFVWLRKEGPEKLQIDVDRIAVMGGSAGGYLTLTTGYRVKPRPCALVSFYGYGDLIGDWYSKPSPHPRHRAIKITEAEAWRQVSGPPISDAQDRKGDGAAFYQFCRQQGSWPRNVSGWDAEKEAEKFVPYMPVKNISADYPPTMLIHGTADTDVPYEQSTMMADELKRHGVAHELITIPNGEHGFGGGDPKLIDSAYVSALAFVERYVREKS